MPTIEPQQGFQQNFLSSEADIIIGGAAAGVGKTYALLLDPLRYIDNPNFGAVFFRRETPQIRNIGGLWDTSKELYFSQKAIPKEVPLEWNFPNGATIKFSHLQLENDKLSWQGSQIPWIGFDELTHFTEGQFFYLLSRNRSTCGVKPCIRATCNPDPDSWVKKFIQWWINPETGYLIPERDGVIRYFIKDQNEYVWGDTKQEVIDKVPHIFDNPELKNSKKEDLIKSVSFIAGNIYDNKKLLNVNPEYLSSLLSLSAEEQAQLLGGNWNASQDNLALGEYKAINNIFSNFVKNESEENFIVVDVAGYGQDLAIVTVFEDWQIKEISILTKSSPQDLENLIEESRENYFVMKSNVLIDSDGLGWGLSGKDYTAFYNGATAIKEDDNFTFEKIQQANYKNLKTQCYYYLFEHKINKGKLSLKDCIIKVDGIQTNQIKRGQKMIDIQEIITRQLKTIKRKQPDSDGKKMINTKEEQKVILGGESPDFADTLMMRSYFDLKPNLSVFFSF